MGEETSVNAASATGCRVLLVEDHADSAVMLGRLLGRAGFDVTTVATVAGALAVAGRQPFDVLLADIGLPDGTAYDLLAELRKRGPVTAIALTGHDTPGDIERVEAAGFQAHFVKPVDFPKVRDAVRRVCGRAARGAGGDGDGDGDGGGSSLLARYREMAMFAEAIANFGEDREGAAFALDSLVRAADAVDAAVAEACGL